MNSLLATAVSWVQSLSICGPAFLSLYFRPVVCVCKASCITSHRGWPCHPTPPTPRAILYLHHSYLRQSVAQHFSPCTSDLWCVSVRLLASHRGWSCHPTPCPPRLYYTVITHISVNLWPSISLPVLQTCGVCL